MTIYLNWREIVTLMTLGARPEMLVIGYLKNQDLIRDLHALDSVIIDWKTQSAAVITSESLEHLDTKLSQKTVTSGCGQGTMFGNVLQRLEHQKLQAAPFPQSELYALLEALTHYNQTYKAAGAVHGCALCQGNQILSFVEDIGRHNAVDTLTGEMWLSEMSGEDKIFTPQDD